MRVLLISWEMIAFYYGLAVACIADGGNRSI